MGKALETQHLELITLLEKLFDLITLLAKYKVWGYQLIPVTKANVKDGKVSEYILRLPGCNSTKMALYGTTFNFPCNA